MVGAGRHRGVHICRRAVATLTIGCVLIGTIGVPMPAGIPPRSTSSRFPCEGHGCGCLTAEMCRTNCCCVKKVSPPPTRKPCCSTQATQLADASIETGSEAGSGDVPANTPVAAHLSPLECKGLTTHWVALSIGVVGGGSIVLNAEAPLLSRIVPVDEMMRPLNHPTPPSPPPKV